MLLNYKNWSFRYKIFFAVFIPFILSKIVVLIFLDNSTIVRGEDKTKIYANELTYGLSVGIKLKVEKYISEISVLAESLGAIASGSDLDPNIVNKIFPSVIGRHKNLLNAWLVLEPTGGNKAYTTYWYRGLDGVTGQAAIDMEKTPTIERLVALSKQSKIANIATESSNGNQNMLLIAYPIIDDKNNYVGSIGFGVSLASFKELLEDAKNYGVSTADLIKSDGSIIESSDEIGKSAQLNSSSFQIAQKFLMMNDEYLTTYFSEALKKKVYDIYLPIKFDNIPDIWIVHAVYPLNRTHTLLWVGAIGAVFLIIGISIIMLIANGIASSLKNLATALGEISKGNLNVEIPKVASNDEIGYITNAAVMYKKHFQDMMQAKKEAEEAAAAKTEFLANISHELRTPMHAVLSYAKLGLEKLVDKPSEAMAIKLKKYFSNIRISGERLLKLLNDLLDLSKLEAGKIEFNFAATDINESINKAVAELSPLLSDKKLNLNIKALEPNEVVSVDEEKFIQVLINLLSNAIKFSKDGNDIGISVTKNDAENILVSVEDNGVGVPEGELDKIFDAFTQSSKTNKGAGGTGLGLSIAKEIVEAHNGKIWAENNPTKGSVFKVLLPIRHVEGHLKEGV